MNKNNNKILLLSATIILVILCISWLIIKNINKENTINNTQKIETQEISDDERIRVANVVVNYVDSINNKKEIVNNIIAPECSNTEEKLKSWSLNNISKYEDDTDISLYYVDYVYNGTQKKLVVKLDKVDNTYSIYTNDYIAKNGVSTIPKTLIEKNDNNNFLYIEDNTYHRVLIYMQNYLMITEADLKASIELLDANYYSTFKSEEEYSQMVDTIKEAITTEVISEFSKENNIISFKIGNKADIQIIENEFMDYTLILDSYRLKKKEYSNLSNEKKAEKIVNDFVEMIKIGDYESLYGILNEKFRNNNYDSIEALKDKMTNEIGNINRYSVKKIGNSISKQYQYQINISNFNEQNKTIDLIVILIDNEDFEISFSIKE